MKHWRYTLLLLLVLPFAPLYLWWRGRRQPEYRQHWGERFFASGDRAVSAVPPAPTFWIHAVSVGETRAAQPLVRALRERYPDHRILFSHTTPTGRATSLELFGDSVQRVYLPYDTPWAVTRFLRRHRPCCGLIMETELWPNLIAACGAERVPILLVNARLSARSAARYARFPALTRETLAGLSAIAAQTAADAARLHALGAPAENLSITGNLKFDSRVPPAQLALADTFRQRCGPRPVWLTASTREGEEALILAAWAKVAAKVGAGGTAPLPTPLLALVPRHPQRFDAVAQLVQDAGLTLQRRSDNAQISPDTDVVLGDSMGEMLAWYAVADVAFIGGSLLDFGSQNLIEACAVGTPVLIGPSRHNFAAAAAEALACGAARPIADADDLVQQVLELLADPPQRQSMGQAGQDFVARHQGATAKTVALVAQALSKKSG